MKSTASSNMTRCSLLLALGCLFFGGCSYCASPYDYCGPLFGGIYDPYGADCGCFDRVGSAFSGVSHYHGELTPVDGTPIPADDYYNPDAAPPMPVPTNVQTLRASVHSADPFAVEEDGYGPLLLQQDGSDTDGVASNSSQ